MKLALSCRGIRGSYNQPMRMLLTWVLLACAATASALETARSLAASGAPHLALARVEQLQPGESAAPRWAEWETLRLVLLVDLKRNDEALKRAAALPSSMPSPALRSCLMSATRAAVALGLGARARAYAARLLWQLEPAGEEARAARLLVIESQLADRKGETAFRAMLRYEQDFRPLDRATAGRFVEALLDLGLDKEAVNWLASLGEASATKLRLRMRTGLIGPDSAIAQARAQLGRQSNTGQDIEYWRVLGEAAARQGNGALRVEALEQLLNHYAGNEARSSRTPAQDLWQAYLSEAQTVANRDRLLAGDDVAWSDHAARHLGSKTHESRSLYAYLARNGAKIELRHVAQLQLVFSLYQGGLDHAALHLFSDGNTPAGALDSRTRYLLGEIAETRHMPALAVRFWQGLSAPIAVSTEEWQIRFATAQWRAGALEGATDTMRLLATQHGALPRPAVIRALALGREIAAAGKAGLAEELLAGILPLIAGDLARDALFALGAIAESAAHFARAADYFMRSAIAPVSHSPDAQALQARLAAAVNLARTGFREDARAQFQWVIGNSKDVAQVEHARAELSKL